VTPFIGGLAREARAGRASSRRRPAVGRSDTDRLFRLEMHPPWGRARPKASPGTSPRVRRGATARAGASGRLLESRTSV
jgi:hypothetical protein